MITKHSRAFQVPYELLNKKFRAAQKSLDRDIASVSSSSRELTAQTERSGEVAVEEVVKTLDVMSQKLASLKRRVRGGAWQWYWLCVCACVCVCVCLSVCLSVCV